MSLLLRKEFRLLLPAWITALLAATTPLWWYGDLQSMTLVFFGAGILGLALSPFGQEIGFGTFGLLLVQPEERLRFWRIKTSWLALALGSVWFLFNSCMALSAMWRGCDLGKYVEITAVMIFLAFSGGLWSTLLLRDTVTAFLCTCLAPLAIFVLEQGAMLVLTHQEPENNFFSPTVYLIEGIYCAAGFFWARHLFLSAQDVPWTGGQVYLQGGRTLWPAWLAFRVKKKENRWIALIKKELQLQEVVIFLIPVLAALHVIVLGISHFLKGHTKEWMAMSMPIIWMASVPFLIGCVAVAEERRLNTLEGLLCMPRLSKRASFATKLIISLVLGGVLGGAVPPFLENRSIHMHMDASMAIAVIVTGITFYASTMSKGLLQAIPAAMCIAGLMFGEFALCLKFLVFEEDQIQLTSFDLLNSLWIPAMACTAILLGYQNYRCPQISPWMWLRNFLVASAVYG